MSEEPEFRAKGLVSKLDAVTVGELTGFSEGNEGAWLLDKTYTDAWDDYSEEEKWWFLYEVGRSLSVMGDFFVLGFDGRCLAKVVGFDSEHSGAEYYIEDVKSGYLVRITSYGD